MGDVVRRWCAGLKFSWRGQQGRGGSACGGLRGVARTRAAHLFAKCKTLMHVTDTRMHGRGANRQLARCRPVEGVPRRARGASAPRRVPARAMCSWQSRRRWRTCCESDCADVIFYKRVFVTGDLRSES